MWWSGLPKSRTIDVFCCSAEACVGRLCVELLVLFCPRDDPKSGIILEYCDKPRRALLLSSCCRASIYTRRLTLLCLQPVPGHWQLILSQEAHAQRLP